MASEILNDSKYGTMIALGTETEHPFKFGLKKARLVLAHVEAVRAFVAKLEGVESSRGVAIIGGQVVHPKGGDVDRDL